MVVMVMRQHRCLIAKGLNNIRLLTCASCTQEAAEHEEHRQISEAAAAAGEAVG